MRVRLLSSCWMPVVGCLLLALAAGADDVKKAVAPPQAPEDARPAFVLKAGHRGNVHSAEFSPDGRRVAVIGMLSSVIVLWDTATGQPAQVLTGDAPVSATAFSPDGKLLAAAAGSQVTLWNLADGTAGKTLAEHTDAITALAFSPDGTLLATGAGDNTVILWDVAKGEAGRKLTEQPAHITCLAFSPDGKQLASGADNQTIFLWNTATGAVDKKLTVPTPDVLSCRYSPDGHRLAIATGSYDFAQKRFIGGDILLWPTTADAPERTLPGHGSNITALAFNRQGTALAAGAADGTLTVRDIATGAEQPALTGSILSPDWTRAATWSESGLTLWDLAGKRPLATCQAFDNGAQWFTCTPDGYFTCAPTAEPLLTWQLGTLSLTLDQLGKKFKRPDIVKRALAGDDLAALPALDASQLPPNVGFLTPAMGAECADANVEVQLQAAGLRPIARIALTLNGLPAPPELVNALTVEKPTASSPTFTVVVTFPPGESRLRLRATAYDTNEIPGAPAELMLYRPGAKPSPDNLYVLAVGINDYQLLPAHLRYAAADAKALVDHCRKLEGQPFADVIPTLLTDAAASAAGIREALTAIQANAKENDVVIIALSGHCVRDKQGALYFAACDTDLANPAGTALDWQQLAETVKEIKAKRTVVFADTAIARVPNRPMDNLPARFFAASQHLLFISTAVGETSISRPEWGHSAFLKALLEGLSGKADINPRDGAISLQELSDYTKGRVEELTEKRQHPQLPYADNSELGWVVLPSLAETTADALTAMLQSGELDTAMRDHQGRSLLHLAAATGRVELIAPLLQSGAELNAADNAGVTPLHIAALADLPAMAALLVQKGADIKAVDKNGQTPLDLALINNRGKIIDLLLPLVDANAQDGEGRTPLHYAVAYDRRQAVEQLLARGARVTTPDKQGSTPLHWAATHANAEIIDLLLAHRADPNARDATGLTPLHLAVMKNLTEVAQHLLKGGAAVRAVDKDGRTPLHAAAAAGSVKMVDLLCANGANPSAGDNLGTTPLHIAVVNGMAEVATHLLKNGADVNARDNGTHTPLHWAATQESPAMAELLLNSRADANPHDAPGNTPLHIAAKLNRLATARALIAHGASLNAKNAAGQTPLALANLNKAADVADYLKGLGGFE